MIMTIMDMCVFITRVGATSQLAVRFPLLCVFTYTISIQCSVKHVNMCTPPLLTCMFSQESSSVMFLLLCVEQRMELLDVLRYSII